MGLATCEGPITRDSEQRATSRTPLSETARACGWWEEMTGCLFVEYGGEGMGLGEWVFGIGNRR